MRASAVEGLVVPSGARLPPAAAGEPRSQSGTRIDQLDHSVMLATLGEKIDDNRFLRLIGQMLQAGYLEDWVWNATLSGAPQGGVLSPCLSNIYLDRLDKFVDTTLMPEYTRGVHRSSNPEYKRISSAIRRARKRGDYAAARALQKQQRSI